MLQEIKFELAGDQPNWENLQNSTEFDAVALNFFIKKEYDAKINWHKPLIQNSQIDTKIRICNRPFAQGSMRFAFYALDTRLNQKLVAKLPKLPLDHSVEEMCKDLESQFICQHIVNEFNERVIAFLPSTKLLLNFAYCFIYQLKPKG